MTTGRELADAAWARTHAALEADGGAALYEHVDEKGRNHWDRIDEHLWQRLDEAADERDGR